MNTALIKNYLRTPKIFSWLGICLVLIICMFIFWSTYARDTSRTNATLTNRIEELENSSKRAQERERLKDDYQALSKLTDDQLGALYEFRSLSEIITAVSQVATATGLSTLHGNNNIELAENGTQTVELALTLEGEYTQFRDFLTRLFNLDGLILVNKTDCNSVIGQPKIRCRLDLSAFILVGLSNES